VTTTEPAAFRAIRDFFCSLKLTMFTLITLAILSIIGTVVPQGTLSPEYLQSISQNKLKLYQSLGFFDMYHSWWFILLLSLLSLNLIACSARRLPGIWQTITQPPLQLADGLAKTLPNNAVIKATTDTVVLKNQVAALLSAEFAAPVITEKDGAFHLFAQKAPWSRLAVYAVHLSVLVIFIGAIIGSLFGYKGFVNIPEGQSVDTVMSRQETEIALGFAVRCEKFSVAYYPNGSPREFKSILTVLENGRPVAGYNRVPVIVNDPLTYKGITFYQSSYGNLGEHEFVISEPDGSNPQIFTISSNGVARLPDGSSLTLQETTPDISQYQAGVNGPAAKVQVHTATGEHNSFIVYSNNPARNGMNLAASGGKLLQYVGGEEIMYTGLQVAKDPGVWTVWFGCTLMMVGIYVAFFISHRRIWVRVENGTITIGGNASKNQGGFQLYMDQLLVKLKQHISQEDSK